MVATIKQVVTVQPGGRIEINDPQLPEGAQAEVTVVVQAEPKTPAERLAAFDALQKSLNLTAEQAAAWMAEVRAEREAWGSRIK